MFPIYRYLDFFHVLLHVLYSKSLLCMILPGRILCYGYMHVKKSINVYCQHIMMLSCFFHSYLSLQLLLLCGDVETNPGPTTKICPECSASVNVKISTCSCGYFFKTNKITIICPQCSSVIHKKKAQCACGCVLKHKEDNSVMQSKQTKRGMETDAHTIERRAKSRKLMAERRASESEAVTMARQQSNRIAMAGKRASESEETTMARRQSNRIAMAGKRASESEETTMARRQSNRIAKAGKRASESEEITMARRESSRIVMAGKRSSKSTIDNAIKNFHTKRTRVCVCVLSSNAI